MKRAGIIFLIFLMLYNISFSLYSNALASYQDDIMVPAAAEQSPEIMVFEISDDALVQPFLMDSEFSNLLSYYSCFENNLNLNPIYKSIHLISTSALLSKNITEVITESILISHKYFIPCYSLVNLLGNLFTIRI